MAQDVISLSSGSATVGGTASLDIMLSSPAGSEPAGVQWTFNYSPSDVVSVNVTPGPAANAAGKTITCQAGSGKYTCILIGADNKAIQNGVIGTAAFRLASSTSSSSVPVQFSATYAALGTGSNVAATGNSAVITVLPAPALSTLSCSPASLTGPGTVSCSVSLSSPAPASGAAVSLSSNSGSLTAPASVTIPAGGSSANFNASAASVTTAVTATISASYGGVTRTASVQIQASAPAPTLGTLSCSPTSLTGPGTVSCSVSLSSAAPASGAAVSLSSNSGSLTAPASVTIPGGGSSANFNASAASVTTTVTATISASYGGVTRTASVQIQASAPAPTQPALSAIACNPYTVAAGGTTTCSVSLTAAALSGGFGVAIASNNGALTVPASITVPQGAAAASFTAVAGAPTTNQTVAVMASASGVSRSCSVTVAAAVVTPPPPTTSGIRFIQANGATDNNVSSAASVAFTAPNTAGNIIIVAVSWGDAKVASLSASDSAGNAYYVATNTFDNNQRQGLAILYAPNVKAYTGQNRVSVNLGAQRGYRRIVATEYSGVAATSPLDVISTNVAKASTAPNGATSGAATTRSNGELIFGAVMDDEGITSIGAGPGFTQRASVNNKDLAVQDLVQATAGSIASTQTFGARHRYLAHMATFKAAASGGTVTPPPPPPPPPAPAGISFVQANEETDDNPVASASVQFTAGNTAGNAIIVAVSWGDAAAAGLYANDLAGNQYYVATNVFDDVMRQGLAILYAPNVKAYSGQNRVTVTFGSGRSYRRIIATEYRGVATTNPLDVIATNIGTATTATDNVTSRAATTSSSGQLIFGAVMDDEGTTGIAAGTGFTQRASVNYKDLAVQDRVQAAAGSIASTQTFATPHRYLAHMATFRAQ